MRQLRPVQIRPQLRHPLPDALQPERRQLLLLARADQLLLLARADQLLLLAPADQLLLPARADQLLGDVGLQV